MGVVTLLALFSIGLYLQRRMQTKPVETNRDDVPSECISERDGDVGAVSTNIEIMSMFAVYHRNLFTFPSSEAQLHLAGRHSTVSDQ